MKAYARVDLELHSCLTSAVDGGGYHLHASVALPAGKEVALPIEFFSGWASQSWCGRLGEKIFTPLRGIEP